MEQNEITVFVTTLKENSKFMSVHGSVKSAENWINGVLTTSKDERDNFEISEHKIVIGKK